MTLNELIENQGGLDRINQVWNLDGIAEIEIHLAKCGIKADKNGQLKSKEYFDITVKQEEITV